MKKIITHLWFDKEAKQAAEFYTTVFPHAKINSSNVIKNTPSGDCDIVTMTIGDQDFTLLSAGPYFNINPSVSFLVACQTKEEVDNLYNKLSDGGSALMPLGTYPFSEHYGWMQDKFGVSWQIMLMGKIPTKQKITPTMMFVGDNAGKAEEAINFYTSVFHNSKVGDLSRYEDGDGPDPVGTIKHGSFMLEGQYFSAMDSAYDHQFAFNEAISFLVHCNDQAEIDYYWEKLSAVPDSEQCGWLKDTYGFSWQIVPTMMDDMLSKGTEEQNARVTQAFLKMKKFDLAELQRAFDQE